MHPKPHSFVVLDQNQMRRPDKVSAAVDLCHREDFHILVPNVAAFEFSKVISKGRDPLLTWKRSLGSIAAFSEHVVVGRKLPDMWKEEIDHGIPSVTIIDDGATELFRNLLRQVSSGNESGLRDLIDGSVMQLLPTSLDHWSTHDDHKVMLGKVRDYLKSQFDKVMIKCLRTTPADGMAAWLSSDDGVRHVFQLIRARSTSPEAALRLATEPSAIGGFLSGIAAIGLYWLAFGGLDAAKPEAATNDLLDLEYAIIASLSHSLLTEDKRLNVIHNAIRIGHLGRKEWYCRACNFGPAKA